MTQLGAIVTAAFLVVCMFVFIFYQHPSLITLPWAVGKHGFLLSIEFIANIFNINTPTVSYVNNYFSQNDYSGISYSTMGKIEDKMYMLGGWLPPFIIIALGVHLIIRGKPKYVKAHNFESLLEQETHYWRFNRYLVKINPFNDSKDMTKGKFRMAEQPTVFLTSRDLIQTIENAPAKLHREKAKKVFVPTLGKLIAGLESFSENEKIILAIFLAILYPEKGSIDKPGPKLSFSHIDKLGRDYSIRGLCGDISFYLAGEMSKSHYEKQVDEILDKCWDCPYVQEKLKKHAFTSTFIRGMYVDVKRGGSFPPSYIAWMKMLDRNLFYNLHSTGVPGTTTEYVKKENQPGKTIEVAMIIRHYSSERVANTAIPTPEFDLLANDIDDYLERRFEMRNGL